MKTHEAIEVIKRSNKLIEYLSEVERTLEDAQNSFMFNGDTNVFVPHFESLEADKEIEKRLEKISKHTNALIETLQIEARKVLNRDLNG